MSANRGTLWSDLCTVIRLWLPKCGIILLSWVGLHCMWLNWRRWWTVNWVSSWVLLDLWLSGFGGRRGAFTRWLLRFGLGRMSCIISCRRCRWRRGRSRCLCVFLLWTWVGWLFCPSSHSIPLERPVDYWSVLFVSRGASLAPMCQTWRHNNWNWHSMVSQPARDPLYTSAETLHPARANHETPSHPWIPTPTRSCHYYRIFLPPLSLRRNNSSRTYRCGGTTHARTSIQACFPAAPSSSGAAPWCLAEHFSGWCRKLAS